MTIALLIVSHAVVLGLGWYGHYRYGSSVKNAIASVETRVQADVKKL